jgi:hypothetical protein
VAVAAVSKPDPGVAVVASMSWSVIYALLGLIFVGAATRRCNKIIADHEKVLAEADRRLAEEDRLRAEQAAEREQQRERAERAAAEQPHATSPSPDPSPEIMNGPTTAPSGQAGVPTPGEPVSGSVPPPPLSDPEPEPS